MNESDGPDPVGSTFQTVTVQDDTYVEATLVYTAQEDDDQIDFYLRRHGDQVDVGDKFYVDAASLTAKASVIPAHNLISNASFEQNTSGWGSYGGSLAQVSDSLAPHGTHALEVTDDPGCDCGGYNAEDDGDTVNDTQANYDYRFRAWVRANSISDGEHLEVVVREWDNGDLVGSSSQTLTIEDGAYVEADLTYTAQADGDQIDYYLRRTGDEVDSGDGFFVDAASMTATAPASHLSAPEIWGAPMQGETLEARRGLWSPAEASDFTYHWLRCDETGANCASADDSQADNTGRLSLTGADIGHSFKVRASASNQDGTESATSTPTAPVTAADTPSYDNKPVIYATPDPSLKPVPGTTLEASSQQSGWYPWPVPTGFSPYDKDWPASSSLDYQWQRCSGTGNSCSDIAGATNPSYQLVGADVGHRFRVSVTGTNSAGSATAISKRSQVVVQLEAPELQSDAPPPWTEAGGDPAVGSSMVADGLFWGFHSGYLASNWLTDGRDYQWLRCDETGANCQDISGADGSRYFPTTDDIGSTLAVHIVATNDAGSDEAITPASAVVGPEIAADLDSASVSQYNAFVDSQVYASFNLTDPRAHSNDFAASYQWIRCDDAGANCEPIDGQTALRYTPTTADLGQTLEVEVTAENAAGSDQLTSAPTAVVSQLPEPEVLDPPQISNNTWPPPDALSVGQPLTGSDSSTWSWEFQGTDETGKQVFDTAWQWQRCDASGDACQDIPSTASRSFAAYLPHDRDVGHTLRVKVAKLLPSGDLVARSNPTEAVSQGGPRNLELPEIEGAARARERLVANPGEWDPANATISYQWSRCGPNDCGPIAGATDPVYDSSEDDLGYIIWVDVTASDDDGQTTITAAPTDPLGPAAPPENVEPPAISGTAEVGETLSADNGTWHGAQPMDLAGQWLRCDQNGDNCQASGAGSQRQLTSDDLGYSFRYQVTASNDLGQDTAVSQPTDPVQLPPAPVNTEAPTINGTLAVGETVSADEGQWQHQPTSFSYQWRTCDPNGANCADIPEATERDYLIQPSDQGNRLQVEVTAVNGGGETSALSDISDPVAAIIPPQATANPEISGSAREGVELTTSDGQFSGGRPLSFSYQWLRCDTDGANCTAIPDATSSTYTLSSDDVAHKVRSRVTATNDGGSDQATSDPTRLVASAEEAPTEPSPVMALGLNEGAGDSAHDSLGDNDAQIDGATWGTGKYGDGLSFDGVNDKLTIPNSGQLDFTDGFTLEAWVKPTSSSSNQPIMAKQGQGFAAYGLEAADGSGNPAGFVADDDSEAKVAGDSPLSANSWSHLALTFDGDQLDLFVGGNLVASGDGQDLVSSNGALEIGANSATSKYFEGSIDEVRLYDEPIAADQIQRDRDIPVTDGTQLPSTIDHDMVLRASGSPYTGDDVTVAAGAEVLAEPGAVVKVHSLGVDGVLTVNGHDKRPVVFTKPSGTSIGDWDGITINASGSEIRHADIRYANTGVTIGNTSATIVKSTIHNNVFAGISMHGPDWSELPPPGPFPTSSITDSVIRDNDGYGITYGAASPEIARNSVTGNAYDGIDFEAFDGGDVNIHDNTVAGNAGNGINVRGPFATSSRFEDNTAAGNGGYGISYVVSPTGDGGGSPLPSTIDENTISDNGRSGLEIGGTIGAGDPVEFEDHGYPYVMAPAVIPTAALSGGSNPRTGGYLFITENGLIVADGARLVLDPGVTVKGGFRDAVHVHGAVEADGTREQPVTFTSLFDDSVGGDSDASERDKAPGDWGAQLVAGGGLLYYADSSEATKGELDHVQVAYADSNIAINCPCPHPPAVRNSLITRSSDSGVWISDGQPGDATHGGDPVEDSVIAGNVSDAITKVGSGTAYLRANFVGSDAPGDLAGGGAFDDSISGNVVHNPDRGSGGDDCPGENCDRRVDPIALATGAFTYEHTDLSLTTPGGQLAFSRSYNSDRAVDIQNGPIASNKALVNIPANAGMGPGWSQLALMRVLPENEAGDLRVIVDGGFNELFTKTAEGDYRPPSGTHLKLEADGGGGYTLTKPDQTVYAFDANGDLAFTTDDHGLVTEYDRDSQGRVSSIIDQASGQSLSFTYETDSSSLIASVSDSTGRTVTYDYDADGNLASVTDPLDNTTTYSYDGQHRLTSVTDARGKTFVSNQYDDQNRVVRQENATGDVWTQDYAPNSTTVTDPENGVSTYDFNSDQRLISETDPLERTTTYDYNAAGDRTGVSQPGGADWTYDYDSAGNLTYQRDPEGGERFFTFDSDNHMTSRTDERSKTWTYTWNGSNDLTEIEDPDSQTKDMAYDANGQMEALTDENGHTSHYGHDANGNLISVEDGEGHVTSFTYDDYNNLHSVTRPGLAAEVYDRNALGDLLSLTTPEGHVTHFDYDENGALTKVTDPATNQWKIERDDMERPTAYVDPLNQRTETTYDGNGNPLSVTDRKGHVTSYGYDDAGQLTSVDAPATGTWSFDYDQRGNRDQVIDPRSKLTTYDYDLADRLTATHEPESTDSSYGYDAAGNLTRITDPNGHETSLVYDDLGRLAELDQPLGQTTTFDHDPAGNLIGRTTAQNSQTLAYDNADRLTSIKEGSSTLRAFGYDAADRLTSATDAQAKTLTFGYDDDGNLTSINDDRGQTVSRVFDSRGNLTSQTDGRGTVDYTYDELNRITQLTDPSSDVIGFDYDPEGNLTEATLPNGVTTTNTYDNANRMLSTASVDSSSATIQAFDYAYDATGNRISSTDRNSDTTTYTYDDLNRLTQFDPPTAPAVDYAYDDAGNRTQAGSVTYTYNALNQLVSDTTGTDYTYDGAGRLVQTDDGTSTIDYSYDALDQLLAVNDGSNTISYSYDGLGRRSERTEGGSTETAHYGDLSDLAILDTGAGGVLRTWLQGPLGSASTNAASMGLLEQGDSSGTAFPLAEAHGDITTLATSSGGVASRQSFDPWGAQLSGTSLPMGWLGAYERRSDDESRQVQMGVRSYSPGQGRFISQDPVLALLGMGQTASRYEYAGQNPSNWFDLDGRMLSSAGGGYWDPTHVGEPPKPDGLRGDDLRPCQIAGTVMLVPRTMTCPEIKTTGSAVCAAWSDVASLLRPGDADPCQEFSDAYHAYDDAMDCLQQAISHPSENLDCLPNPGQNPLDPSDHEWPEDEPPPPPPPVPPTRVPLGI